MKGVVMKILKQVYMLTFLAMASHGNASEQPVTFSKSFDKSECAVTCQVTPKKFNIEIVKKDHLKKIGESFNETGASTSCSEKVLNDMKLTCSECNIFCNPNANTKK